MKHVTIVLRCAVRVTMLSMVAACAEPTAVPGKDAGQLLVWRQPDVKGESVPVFDSTTVYFLQQIAHVVAAVDRTTGATRWKRTLETPDSTEDGYGLALAGGVLVVGNLDVFGLDPATGAVRWKFAPTQGVYPGFGSLTTDGRVVYCGSVSGHMYAIDAATGAQLWVTSLLPAYTQIWNPIVADGIVYAGFTQSPDSAPYQTGGTAAFDAKSGAVLWKTFVPPGTYSNPTANNAGVTLTPSLVVMGSSRGVYGLDRSTGKIKVTVDSSVFGDIAWNRKLVRFTGVNVVVGSGAPGTVTALDPTDLHRLWGPIGGGSVEALTSDDARLYVARVSTFEVYRLSDGLRLWTLAGSDIGAPGELYLAAPALDAARIYLPGTKGVSAFTKQ